MMKWDENGMERKELCTLYIAWMEFVRRFVDEDSFSSDDRDKKEGGQAPNERGVSI